MKYLEVTFTTHPCNETVNDVVSALAGDIGFESFVECEGGIQAYIQQALFNKEVLDEMISEFPIPNAKVEYTVKEAEDKNWNEEWEKNFLKESDTATIRSFEGEVLGVQLPDKVTLQITEAEQAVKGDTATGATKNAVLETGFQIKVPLFINEGEMVVISTAEGKYSGRA